MPNEEIFEDGDLSQDEMEVDEVPEHLKKAYIPGISAAMNEQEEWEFDPEAYLMFHVFETTKPCMTFDILTDDRGEKRTTYPMQMNFIAGSQWEERRKNELYVIRLANLIGTEKKKETAKDGDEDEEDDSESSGDESEDDDVDIGKASKKDPILYCAYTKHGGNVNRIKGLNIGTSTLSAVWNDLGRIQIWNMTEGLKIVNEMEGPTKTHELLKQIPVYNNDQGTEGFALAWAPLTPGLLATGNQRSQIFIHNMGDGGVWTPNKTPLRGHTESVEDIQWSSTDASLFMSCSADKSIRLWDVRSRPKDACVVTVENAHDADVNVLSWNQQEKYIVTGGDDGVLKVWTDRSLQAKIPVATFKHHTKPITSVEWCPSESATFMASGEDDQTTIWDLAVETEDGAGQIEGVPPQLLFIHMGQKEVKEVHWHKQLPGIALTTSVTGFNIFRTISV